MKENIIERNARLGVEWRQTERQTTFFDAIDAMYPTAIAGGEPDV